jgi:acyl-CoA reductase-like NAD-dependent aldehyde dehydrogenase
MRAAAENMSRVTLDVGGNDPAIVLDDATLDAEALGRLVAAAFVAAGQVHAGIKRIYVSRSRYTELVDGMSAVLDRYVVGHGLAPETTMGPLNNARQRDLVVELLGEARAAGVEVRELGRLTEQAEREGGFFLRPALVLDPKPDLRIVTEDQFGPALPICRYDDDGALVDRLNGEWTGLGASVWTSDRDRADDLAGRLHTATTRVNHASAVRRELGALGLLDFSELRTVIYPT